MEYPVLDKINTPDDLKKLSQDELVQLCADLRQYIVRVLSTHPGHLASGLGVVELAVALHFVFNTPDDKLVWDVGHQAYPHKILTGRKRQFESIRSYGGISGFPKVEESPYDSFGTGHSSTSISAALGMAVAAHLQGNDKRNHIAVIGDGSMTGGMAFEALNHAGEAGANVLVVLNDNGISIDKSVGALSHYLTKMTSSRTYNRVKTRIWNASGTAIRRFFRNILLNLKSTFFKQSNMFEAFGFRYFGPIDGHNLPDLVNILQRLSTIKGPKLLHIVTQKGRGMDKAVQNPVAYHAPGEYDVETGERKKSAEKDKPLRYQDIFGNTILELARKNDRIVGITPAMPTGCSLNIMMEAMPDRCFDVGIAEQHAVTFAAGLAAQGMTPFCNIYSSFMQRAYDQVIHDVALQRLNVVMCLDRAGLVGEDGPTHHGAFDYAYFRPIPNLVIAAPMDENELRNMMYTAQLPDQGPFVIRYPRGRSVNADWKKPFQELPVGKGRCLRNGREVAILSVGHIGNTAMAAAQLLSTLGVEVGVYDMRFVKPIDEGILHEVAKTYTYIVTLEDGVLNGGFGSAVLEFLADNGIGIPVHRLGLPDKFVAHGSLRDLYRECRIDEDAVVSAVLGIVKSGK